MEGWDADDELSDLCLAVYFHDADGLKELKVNGPTVSINSFDYQIEESLFVLSIR